MSNSDDSTRVIIRDLANDIATRQADAHSGKWKATGADNDLRRDIAVAMNTNGLRTKQIGIPGILSHIRQMMEKGQIVPLSAFNGMPSTNAAEVYESWCLTRQDADKVIAFLSSASQQSAQPIHADDSKEKSWIVDARRLAGECIARHKKQDLFPSQSDVCAEVAKKMLAKKIYGAHGKPLEQNYIQRNAIQGKWWRANKP